MVRPLPAPTSSTLSRVGAVLAGCLALACPMPADAHAIQSTLERVQAVRDELMLSSAFSSGEPAADATVRLVPPGGGVPIEVGRTNSKGQLSFALPKAAQGDWELQIDGGPGHRDYLEMPVRQGQVQIEKLSHAVDAPARTDFFAALAGGTALLAGVVAQVLGRRRPSDPR